MASSGPIGVDSGEVELELIDGVPRVFLDRLEDVFDNNNKIYLQQTPESAAFPPLQEKYDHDTLISVLSYKGASAFCVGIVKPSENQNISKFVIANDRGDEILVISRSSGFMGTRFTISGAGILEFNLRRTAFGSYVAYDKWKNLFKIHSWTTALTPRCLSGRSRSCTVQIRDLDGTWTGAMGYNVAGPEGAANSEPSPFTSITFAPGLNRKAKYIMFAACLIPYTSHFIPRSKR